MQKQVIARTARKAQMVKTIPKVKRSKPVHYLHVDMAAKLCVDLYKFRQMDKEGDWISVLFFGDSTVHMLAKFFKMQLTEWRNSRVNLPVPWIQTEDTYNEGKGKRLAEMLPLVAGSIRGNEEAIIIKGILDFWDCYSQDIIYQDDSIAGYMNDSKNLVDELRTYCKRDMAIIICGATCLSSPVVTHHNDHFANEFCIKFNKRVSDFIFKHRLGAFFDTRWCISKSMADLSEWEYCTNGLHLDYHGYYLIGTRLALKTLQTLVTVKGLYQGNG